jgi:UDP-2-acetamido-3-amino-2,3-dideoxy-glucuronate N-acetyltransferase
MSAVDVHPTAVVDEGAVLSPGVRVWHFARVREGARVGERTIVAAAAYIGAGVLVGEHCKIENAAQLFEGATVGDGVFVGPGVMLTNDRHPRAVNPDLSLKGADDWQLEGVRVLDGASLGAGSIVLSGLTVGRWSMIAAGALVSRDVGAFELVGGSPSRHMGWVCRCGVRVRPPAECQTCGRVYRLGADGLVESDR